ncbi:class I SAM-dependent methyltransferase [uncultured Enterovirga sp.]|uniref:class I SAM-dependent methyltransferase n=1 Tax=uncultured Enterovirga sp. TaxID=2026352 RepID=UPI0035C96133
MNGLVSPVSGERLRPDGPDLLTDGAARWPILDGIPYLRTGRETLVAEAVRRIESGDREAALVLLLADQDDWWDGPAPSEADLRRLVRERDALTLREAMGLLAFGRVGDYFAHRWSDPTYLAGLALLDAHWTEPASAFELACGIGHYLRDLSLRGVRVAGGDVVFAKLWLARHWVAPEAALVCFDARSPWPLAARRYDLALCQDAFYFLEPKAEILARLRTLVSPHGTLAVGHVHSREAANMSAGSGMSATEIEAAFPDATIYDDAELTVAATEGRAPVPRPATDLRAVEAFSLVESRTDAPRRADGPLCRPITEATLRPNPLYAEMPGGDRAVAWPSDRYRAEYAPRATYRPRVAGPLVPNPDAVRRREFLDLPARW